MNSPFYQYRDYMLDRYGEPLYRVPIDFDFGCPNRNRDRSGGCTFCNERGGRAMQTLKQNSVEDQIKEAIRFSRDRYDAKLFMAYVQAYSAGFLPENCRRYRELLSYGFRAFSFGARPDTLGKQAFAFLSEFKNEIETWAELGVQTVHDKTLIRIQRGHDWETSREAILKLKECGVHVAVHVIIGLPGESRDDFVETARTLSELPIDGIKIHNLHVVKNTELANEYAREPFPTYNEYEYGELIIEFLRNLRSDLPVIRISTDSLLGELIAPCWNMNKSQFRDYIISQMLCREWRQGDKRERLTEPPAELDVRPVKTSDGSFTFWSEKYKEHYHTTVGARLEAENKYILPSRLAERCRAGAVELLDIGFGPGYNSLSAVDCSIQNDGELSVTALEMDRRILKRAAETLNPSESDRFDWRECLNTLYESGFCSIPGLKTGSKTDSPNTVRMLWGDARHSISSIHDKRFDLIFMDPFSTQRNSELWTLDFFQKLRDIMKPGAILITYSAAIPVRSALEMCGLHVGETVPFGRVRGGTIAALNAEDIKIPLPDEDRKMIASTRGVPYRDPFGVWTNKEILRDREERIKLIKAAAIPAI